MLSQACANTKSLKASCIRKLRALILVYLLVRLGLIYLDMVKVTLKDGIEIGSTP